MSRKQAHLAVAVHYSGYIACLYNWAFIHTTLYFGIAAVLNRAAKSISSSHDDWGTSAGQGHTLHLQHFITGYDLRAYFSPSSPHCRYAALSSRPCEGIPSPKDHDNHTNQHLCVCYIPSYNMPCLQSSKYLFFFSIC